MSVEVVYLLRKGDPPSSLLRELDEIVLLDPVVTSDGDTVPVGTEGTIVAVWSGGEAYEVEFAEPEGLATVAARSLRPAGSRVPSLKACPSASSSRTASSRATF